MKLFGFRLLVGDFAATIAFWRDVMKIPLTFSDETIGYALFDTGEAKLEFFQRDAFAEALGQETPVSAPTGQRTVINFTVDDVDTAYADFVARGAKAVASPVDRPVWQARTAHLSDPEGNLIEIYSMLRPTDAPTQ